MELCPLCLIVKPIERDLDRTGSDELEVSAYAFGGIINIASQRIMKLTFCPSSGLIQSRLSRAPRNLLLSCLEYSPSVLSAETLTDAQGGASLWPQFSPCVLTFRVLKSGLPPFVPPPKS